MPLFIILLCFFSTYIYPNESAANNPLLYSNMQTTNMAAEKNNELEAIRNIIDAELEKFEHKKQPTSHVVAVETPAVVEAVPVGPTSLVTPIAKPAPIEITPPTRGPELPHPFNDKDLNSFTVSFNTKGGSILEVLPLLSKVTSLDIIVDPEISAQCGQLSFNSATPGKILFHLCKQASPELTIAKSHDIVKIQKNAAPTNSAPIPVNAPDEYIQHIKDLKHSHISDEFIKKLETIWGGYSQKDSKSLIHTDKHSNKVLIRGKKSDVQQFANYLDSIDVPKLRVKIDVMLVLTDKSYGLNWGVNWSGIYNRLNSIVANKKDFGFVGLGGTLTDFPTPTQPINATDGNLYVNPRNLAVNLFTNAFQTALDTFAILPIVFGGPDLNLRRLNLILNASEQENKSKILAKPSVTVTNNEIAKILVGQSVPIYTAVTESVQSTVRQLSQLNYKEIGISLQVLPSVSKDRKTVSMDLFLEATEIISGEFKYDPTTGIAPNPPTLLILKIKDNVVIENGQTMVIGGLLTQRKHETINALPYLSKIPILGDLLFKASNRAFSESEDFIFITPTILE